MSSKMKKVVSILVMLLCVVGVEVGLTTKSDAYSKYHYKTYYHSLTLNTNSSTKLSPSKYCTSSNTKWKTSNSKYATVSKYGTVYTKEYANKTVYITGKRYSSSSRTYYTYKYTIKIKSVIKQPSNADIDRAVLIKLTEIDPDIKNSDEKEYIYDANTRHIGYKLTNYNEYGKCEGSIYAYLMDKDQVPNDIYINDNYLYYAVRAGNEYINGEYECKGMSLGFMRVYVSPTTGKIYIHSDTLFD